MYYGLNHQDGDGKRWGGGCVLQNKKKYTYLPLFSKSLDTCMCMSLYVRDRGYMPNNDF